MENTIISASSSTPDMHLFQNSLLIHQFGLIRSIKLLQQAINWHNVKLFHTVYFLHGWNLLLAKTNHKIFFIARNAVLRRTKKRDMRFADRSHGIAPLAKNYLMHFPRIFSQNFFVAVCHLHLFYSRSPSFGFESETSRAKRYGRKYGVLLWHATPAASDGPGPAGPCVRNTF